MSDLRDTILEALAKSRTRSSWNDRLTHWERPPSVNEEAQIQRAANAATALVTTNALLTKEGASIRPQGSYFNNTNVRLEADMDLRVQLPDILVKYDDGIDTAQADAEHGYIRTGRTFVDIGNSVRNELAAICRKQFGAQNVDVGKKAVTVAGLSGSRADVDLVPAFNLHWLFADGNGGTYVTPGAVIVSADGTKTYNFPQQHNANGIEKRNNTAHRFKKIVRMAKRLNCELADDGAISRRLPSFLVECLIYSVENAYFLYPNDDRYDRLLRVLYRANDLLSDSDWHKTATEVNDIKFLFHSSQNWTLSEARAFIIAAIARLEA